MGEKKGCPQHDPRGSDPQSDLIKTFQANTSNHAMFVILQHYDQTYKCQLITKYIAEQAIERSHLPDLSQAAQPGKYVIFALASHASVSP